MSFFTHNVWHFNDEWSATVGLRYNHENKHGTFDGGVTTWHDPGALIVACGTIDPPAASNALVGAFAIFCHRAPYNTVI